MLLDLTTHTLEIKLAGAVATTELPIVLAFIDGESSNFFPKMQHSISNGTTDVTILDAPEPRGKRMVKFMYIRNVDTASVTLTLQLADSATNREIYKVIMLQDETLIYTDTTGFKIIDTDGNTKVGGGGGFSVPTGNIDIGDAASEGSSGSHSRDDHQHKFTAPSSGYPKAVAAVKVDGTSSKPARDDHVHANMDIGCRAFSDADQTIVTATTSAIALNQEHYDTDTIHDLSTNNSRLTATTAGKYVISGHIRLAANATGTRRIGIRVNGTLDIAFFDQNGDASLEFIVSIATIYDLAAADYVELTVTQTSGGNLNLDATGDWGSEFAMQKIG